MDRTRRLAVSLALNLALVVAQVGFGIARPLHRACWPTPATT